MKKFHLKRKNVFSLETLYKMTHDLKKEGIRIAFTHGAFDLFHGGHLQLLNFSARRGDFLIVGIENDSRVAEYKTHNRPILDEQTRVSIVSQLNFVDAVFLKDTEFDSDTRIRLYKDLHIDILTFGYNYAIEDEIRYDVTRAGATLVRYPRFKEFSTTHIIKDIVDRYTPYKKVPYSDD